MMIPWRDHRNLPHFYISFQPSVNFYFIVSDVIHFIVIVRYFNIDFYLEEYKEIALKLQRYEFVAKSTQSLFSMRNIKNTLHK